MRAHGFVGDLLIRAGVVDAAGLARALEVQSAQPSTLGRALAGLGLADESVVATTIAAPSAPLVASSLVDADSRERLIAALLQAGTAPELAATLDELLLARFVRVEPSDFEVFLERQRAAEAAGYPRLA